MFQVDMQSSDVSLPLNLKPYSIPQFPPIRDAARPFEIWLNVNVFNDYLADYVNTRIIRSQHKLFVSNLILSDKFQTFPEHYFLFTSCSSDTLFLSFFVYFPLCSTVDI